MKKSRPKIKENFEASNNYIWIDEPLITDTTEITISYGDGKTIMTYPLNNVTITGSTVASSGTINWGNWGWNIDFSKGAIEIFKDKKLTQPIINIEDIEIGGEYYYADKYDFYGPRANKFYVADFDPFLKSYCKFDVFTSNKEIVNKKETIYFDYKEEYFYIKKETIKGESENINFNTIPNISFTISGQII